LYEENNSWDFPFLSDRLHFWAIPRQRNRKTEREVDMYYSIFSTGIWILLVLLYALICAGFSSWLASIKGYGAGAWFGLGFLFGVFALFAIGVAPIKKTETKINTKVDKFSIPKSTKINIETLESGTMLNVSKVTTLNEGMGISTKFIKNLMTDTKVKFIRTGESTKEDGITAPWLFVETEEGEQGYCFSHDLEEYKD
jgi:hypothetical protein